MTKILDFSNGTNETPVVIIQPAFKLTGREVYIQFKNGKIPTFEFRVGCNTSNVTGDNVDRILYELAGKELPTLLTPVIVFKGQNAKTSSPKLVETTENWFISKDKRAFPTSEYEIKEINIKEKRKYFLTNPRNWDKDRYPMHFRGGYQLTKSEIDSIQMILQKMKDFFHGEK